MANQQIRDLIWQQYHESPEHEIEPHSIATELREPYSEVEAELQSMEREGWIVNIKPMRKKLESNESQILIVFANPKGTDTLRLGEEDRAIDHSVRFGKYRDTVHLTKRHAATVHDFSRALLDEEFRIVHVSGHGAKEGLLLEQDNGDIFMVPQGALAHVFSRYSPPQGKLECVILNACYSLSTGRLASLGVPYTIAMEGPIDDSAAIEFSRGFYDAIAAGKTIPFAYEEGCDRVEMAAPDTWFLAKLLRRSESPAAGIGSVAGR